MPTLSSIVAKVRKSYLEDFELHYVHPTLYLVCNNQEFKGLSELERYKIFEMKTGLSREEIISPELASILSLCLITPTERTSEYDFLDAPSPGQHWLPLLDPVTLEHQEALEPATPRTIHFYGYKGGQARSTVLAMLAKQLAEDGFRILAVDVDVEAPSLDILLNVAANSENQTLLGLCNPDSKIEPISAYASTISGGKIDLLACRPVLSDYDMDFAAFALRSTLDVTVMEECFLRLMDHLGNLPAADKYDMILFDHRSGLTASVLPVVQACPGPVVICLRVDDQSKGAGSLFDILFRQSKNLPGAYVSFSLDPEETRETLLGRHGRRVNELLDRLGAAIERDSTQYSGSDEDLPPEDFLRYWISWFHDRAFLNNSFPSLSDISEKNRSALFQLREVLGIAAKKAPLRRIVRKAAKKIAKPLSPSGAEDQGSFVVTPEVSSLFQKNTNTSYIFGRKGTGKTRLLKELSIRKLGEPLIVAADERIGGLPSSDTLFTDYVSAFSDRPEMLWWCILGAALESSDTAGEEFRVNLNKWLKKGTTKRGISVSDIAKLASSLKERRVFLIDGIETAFRSNILVEFVESLFKFLLTIQTDSQFSGKLVIRLFLRTDLARRAIQNVEQQTSRRKLELSWSTQSIFNFVLSRIEQISWFRENFKAVCNSINQENKRILAGLLTPEEYEPLLLEIFPKHLRRNNLQTLTFLKTYFSDAASDDETRAAFYPRLFDAFLNYIANSSQLGYGIAPKALIEENRINQALVLLAHEAASRKFLDEVKQELSVLLELAKRPADNERKVGELLAAFDGLTTPFELDECLKKIKVKTGIELSSLRISLHRMKEVGMFEERPGYSGWWRAGRLFKSALRMKYVRYKS